jgi:hypothetical protein
MSIITNARITSTKVGAGLLLALGIFEQSAG